MRENIRGVSRLIGIIVVTVSLLAYYAAKKIVLQSFGKSYYHSKNRFTRTWSRVTATLMGMNLNIEGTPPEAPFFMVTNHLGYVDILPIWMTVNTTFIAKKEVRNWPILGFIIEFLEVLFIDRNNKRDLLRVNAEIREKFRSNQGVVLFPEGTSSKGEEVLPFNPSLMYFPSKSNTPVYYASISYNVPNSTKSATDTVCWWGSMTFANHFFNLLKVKYFEASITFGEKPFFGKNRKEMADKLHQLVSDQFQPFAKSRSNEY